MNAFDLSVSDELVRAISTVAPIRGLRVGDLNDRATWRIDFAPEATKDQKNAANAALAAFDAGRATLIPAIKAEAGRRITAIMPEYKQRNVLATGLAAVTAIGPDTSKWPADLRAINDDASANWQLIQAIRAHSDDLEAALSEGKAVDVGGGSIDGAGAWPGGVPRQTPTLRSTSPI